MILLLVAKDLETKLIYFLFHKKDNQLRIEGLKPTYMVCIRHHTFAHTNSFHRHRLYRPAEKQTKTTK